MVVCGRRDTGAGFAESQTGIDMHGKGGDMRVCCLNGAFGMSPPSLRWTGKILLPSL